MQLRQRSVDERSGVRVVVEHVPENFLQLEFAPRQLRVQPRGAESTDAGRKVVPEKTADEAEIARLAGQAEAEVGQLRLPVPALEGRVRVDEAAQRHRCRRDLSVSEMKRGLRTFSMMYFAPYANWSVSSVMSEQP